MTIYFISALHLSHELLMFVLNVLEKHLFCYLLWHLFTYQTPNSKIIIIREREKIYWINKNPSTFIRSGGAESEFQVYKKYIRIICVFRILWSRISLIWVFLSTLVFFFCFIFLIQSASNVRYTNIVVKQWQNITPAIALLAAMGLKTARWIIICNFFWFLRPRTCPGRFKLNKNPNGKCVEN